MVADVVKAVGFVEESIWVGCDEVPTFGFALFCEKFIDYINGWMACLQEEYRYIVCGFINDE